MGPLEIAFQVASAAYSAEQERKKLDLLRSIASDAAQIRSLTDSVREIVREQFEINEINDQASEIVNAKDELNAGNYEAAHRYARDAANRLMGSDVQLGGSATFLLAAGADITILQEWVKSGNPSAPGFLRDFAARYAGHARDMVSPVMDKARARFQVERTGGQIPFVVLKKDGVIIGRRPRSPANEDYYQNKKNYEAAGISNDLAHPLSVGAETWQAISENRTPNYPPTFQGWLITAIEPASPWALVYHDCKLNFEVASTILNFFPHLSPIPEPIFSSRSFKDVGAVMRGCRCVYALQRPGAFVTTNNQLAKLDSRKPIDDNLSSLEQITVQEYDNWDTLADLHVYPYSAN